MGCHLTGVRRQAEPNRLLKEAFLCACVPEKPGRGVEVKVRRCCCRGIRFDEGGMGERKGGERGVRRGGGMVSLGYRRVG